MTLPPTRVCEISHKPIACRFGNWHRAVRSTPTQAGNRRLSSTRASLELPRCHEIGRKLGGMAAMGSWQTEGLRNNLLFSDLDDDQIGRIGRRCHWKRWDKDQQILGQSEPSTDVFFIVEGTVRAKSYSSAGREVSFTDISEGDLFGEFSAIDGQPRSSSVVSLTPCALGRMPATDFRLTLGECPEAAMKLIELLVGKTRMLSNRVFEFSTLPVHSRIHIELLRLAEQGESDGSSAVVEPAPTHQELAARINTHREAVTRELNRLVAEGLLTLHRGRVDIHDLPGLKALVGDALNS
ncbi:MAG: Crp/Fnr family transcriptional regulator [Alphaproteobacteria bacterium]|nr:Crp/Fnr family transcriptional regulator [Alphaproteobacteria bacterium]